MKNKVAVIVNSLDAYKILWKSYFTILKRRWKDCPFKIYLFAENPDYPNKLIREKGYWSNAYRKALNSIPEEYIFWQDESGIPITKIYTDEIMELLKIMIKEDLVAINANALDRNIYRNRFETDKIYNDFVDLRGDVYSINLQPGFWNKREFLNLLADNETIWQMEVNGTKRASGLEHRIVAPKENKFFEVIDVTVNGRISKEGSEFLKQEGFKIKENHLLKHINRNV